MADPLSVTASILAVVTASVVSIKSLKQTVERYRGRDKTLQRLLGQLDDLINILKTLEEVAQLEASMLALLKGPVDRCRLLCHEFQIAMETFANKSRADYRDWARLEFMKGDINEFMDTLSGYKSTISVGLGTITLQTVKTSNQILDQYCDMIQDTTHELKIHMQRIDEKMARLSPEDPSTSVVNLSDEKELTKHCIRICEDAMSYIGSLADRERQLYTDTLSEHATTGATNDQPSVFLAQQETRKVLDGNRDSLAELVGRLQERLESLASDGHPDRERARALLEQDIKASKESLEICKLALSEVNRQKIYTIGEVVADGDSDQVVVTTMADLFDVKKAISKGNSAQLVGSMSEAALLQLSRDRYGSRFGASERSQVEATFSPGEKSDPRTYGRAQTVQQPTLPIRSATAAPNEMRKRTT